MKLFTSFYSAILILILFVPNTNKVFATHAQSADITYQCLGNNQYQINVSFYRDCSGVNAPNSITINTLSNQCGQSFSTTIYQIPNTGIDVTPICNSLTTVCNGGNTVGVEEYIYEGVITLPTFCNDWTFSFSLCCRNNAINTINNPGGENIYVEALLNNLDFACNNSATFSNPPVSFPCIGQTSCFNHGAIDVDGDSLYYTLIAPMTGPATNVTYIAPYSAQQPLASTPATSFNPNNGDICMTPTMQQVTVLAVKVEEYRNEILIGSVTRDIQLRSLNCNNNLPYTTGINGTGQFSINACAGSPLNFTIPTNDIDAGQTVTLNWNNAIPNATLIDNGAQLPTGTFNWTPTTMDISNIPYCFTVTVSDDNCPLNGVQIYSFCITVSGFSTNTTSQAANCGASNGYASVNISGGIAPFTYQWSPNGGNNATANGLAAGQYTVLVTDAAGCSSTSAVTVGAGGQPGNININSSNISCSGSNDGSATANVNGGQPPYTYLWSNGNTTQTINNLTPGTYFVQVTTSSGCDKVDSVVITEPSSLITTIASTNNVSCFSGNNGDATVNAAGGTPNNQGNYTYLWNTVPTQNTVTANNLSAGNYSVTVTDNNGCTATQNVVITEPQPISIVYNGQQNVSCFGGSDGSISTTITGGNAPYDYNWNNYSFPNTTSINNLPTGIYLLNITDANGCTAVSQFAITSPVVLDLNISTINNVSCFAANDGSIITSTAGGVSPYSYQWNANAGNTANSNNLGAGNFMLTVTDANGCIDTTSAIVTEPTPVTTTISAPPIICPGQTTTLTATGNGGVGNYTFLWNVFSSGVSATVSPTSTSLYMVTAVDGNGCFGVMDSATVIVNDINLVTLNITADTALCEGAAYPIGATVSNGIGNYTLNWSNGLGNGNGPFMVSPLATTNYTVTVTDVCGNSITEDVMVSVNPNPVVNLTPQSAVGCGEVELLLSNNNSSSSGSLFNWDFGDNTFSNQENPSKSYTQTGVYPVSLTITTAAGCMSSGNTTLNIAINPQAIADFEFSPDEITMLNPTATFENLSVNANFYEWRFGDGNTSNLMHPVNKYNTDGTYDVTLIAKTNAGCNDTITKELLIDPMYSFYIPNTFTPNNDGHNEIFTAVGEAITAFNMQIFNRWGELIYETNSLEIGWDGTAKGGSEVSAEGVYVYNIQLKDWEGLNHRFTGHVNLIK